VLSSSGTRLPRARCHVAMATQYLWMYIVCTACVNANDVMLVYYFIDGKTSSRNGALNETQLSYRSRCVRRAYYAPCVEMLLISTTYFIRRSTILAWHIYMLPTGKGSTQNKVIDHQDSLKHLRTNIMIVDRHTRFSFCAQVMKQQPYMRMGSCKTSKHMKT
jgi:hypothetical protein